VRLLQLYNKIQHVIFSIIFVYRETLFIFIKISDADYK